MPAVGLQCPSRLHGYVEEGIMQVKCHSKRCGAGKGVVVLHYFNLASGALINTRKFRDPVTNMNNKEGDMPLTPSFAQLERTF